MVIETLEEETESFLGRMGQNTMRHYQKLCRSLLATTAIVACAGTASSSVRPEKLEELVENSDQIVVAVVTKVENAPAGLKYGEKGPDEGAPKIATARVIEVWKGDPGKEVRYMASRSWVCDIADAEVGERVVLFLGRVEDLPYHVIEHSGRGRMPLRKVGATKFAVLHGDIEFPKGTSIVCEKKPFDPQAPPLDPKGPPPSPLTHYNEYSIKLDTLKRLVKANSLGRGSE